MKPMEVKPELQESKRSFDLFRKSVMRGLAILLPPLLTLVIFLWIGNTIVVHMLEPLEQSVRYVLVEELSDIRTPDDSTNVASVDGRVSIGGKSYPILQKGSVQTVTIDNILYVGTGDGHYIPDDVYAHVLHSLGRDPMPTTAKGIYTRYVDYKWLPRRYVLPLFLGALLLVLYLLGRFLAVGIGKFFWNQVEKIIHRVPLVRNVYSSIKQVTDFLLTEPDIQYTRVVAIEYPRKGIWTLAFVTGEPIHDLRDSFGEPMVSAFVPHSPMPFTGFAVTVKKSETYDLSISVDQALQFVVSCGVVVPPVPELNETLGRVPASSRSVALALSGSAEKNG